MFLLSLFALFSLASSTDLYISLYHTSLALTQNSQTTIYLNFNGCFNPWFFPPSLPEENLSGHKRLRFLRARCLSAIEPTESKHKEKLKAVT